MQELAPQEARLRTEELIAFFDLDEKAGSPIRTFSTGMKKKISLASAMIHRPRLIILDEPLEGIDAVAAAAIKESLALMASKGSTIFITSHVLDTVEKFCTEIAIIHRGKILIQCATSHIRAQTAGLLGNAPYRSLEELFIGLVGRERMSKQLSWL